MRRLVAVMLLCALGAGCRSEPVELLPEYESAEIAARVHNFQIYPGAKFLAGPTSLMRKAFFVMNPRASRALPMAVYAVDAPVEDVARFYLEKAGWDALDASADAEPGATPPRAYYKQGELRADAEAALPVLEQVGQKPDLARVTGRYRGAHIDGTENMPRVDLQRPWVDLATGEVHDSTLILMVRDE